jgi:hypothetical protein
VLADYELPDRYRPSRLRSFIDVILAHFGEAVPATDYARTP